MNYFEFYELEPKFTIDEKTLRKKFLSLSRAFHPDFHTMKSDKEQAEMLEKSTLNNKAYKVLSKTDSRMKYLLDMHNAIEKEKSKLSQAFLMDMMDINEEVMELKFDFNEEALRNLEQKLGEKEEDLNASLQPLFEQYDQEDNAQVLEDIAQLYFQQRYLRRLRQNLEDSKVEI